MCSDMLVHNKWTKVTVSNMRKFFVGLPLMLINLLQPISISAQESQSSILLDEQQMRIAAGADFSLNAYYFQATNSKGGALILHDCNENTAPYLHLAKTLQQQHIDAVLLELRGFGSSTSEKYSHKEIKKTSKDIITYQQNVALLNAYWGDDALLAYNALREKLGNERPISVISSGCTAYTAVQLAEKMHIQAAVYIAPQMDFMAKERYKNLIDIPTYFLGSVHQTQSYQTALELFNWNGDSQTKVQLAKGSLHSSNFLAKDSGLFIDIADWLSSHFNQ